MAEPEFAKHSVLQKTREEVGIPVHYYKTPRSKRLSLGLAPSDTFYTDHTLFVGPQSQKLSEKHSLWHDLCHALVAKPQGKLDYDNFKSDLLDELNTCKIEFWLGFASGYYSLDEVVFYIREYNFDEELDYVGWNGTLVYASVLAFLKVCREEALLNPVACRVAKALGIYSKRHLVQKFQADIAKK